MHIIKQPRTTGWYYVQSTSHLSVSSSPQSATRLTVLDAVKVFAMIMMMQGHTLDALTLPDQLDITTFPWILWFHIRGGTAPIFLTVSGILFALTMRRTSVGTMDKDQALKRVKWAALLMFIGYILVFPASNVLDLPDVLPEGWRIFFQANILQLNAVALTLVTTISLLVRGNIHAMRAFTTLGVVMLIATPWVNHIPWFSIAPEFVAAFLSYDHGSYFPIFPYAVYMLLGAGIGAQLHEQPRSERPRALRSLATRYAMICGVLGAVLLFLEPRVLAFYHELNLLQSFPSVVLLRESAVLFVIALFTFVDIKSERLRTLVELWGRQSLTIYVVHLLVLFGPPWIQSIGHFYAKSLPLAPTAVIAVLVILITLGIVWFQEYLKTTKPHRYAQIKRALILLLTYAILGWGRIPFIK